MNDAEARRLIADLLKDYTPGSILHLLGDVLHANAEDAVLEGDPGRADRLREVEIALYVIGVGVDAAVGDSLADD